MKRKKHGQYFTLTLLFSLVIFCIQFVTVLIAGVVLYFLIKYRIITLAKEPITNVGYPILYMGLISLIVGFVIAIMSSKLPLIPFNKTIENLNLLASGDFKARLFFRQPIGSLRSFQDLSNSFNTLAEELDNTEMLRNDFINNFSHEFKTPIVSIAGFAKLLKRGNLNEQQRKEYLDIIEEESLRLSYMATNVLNLTKVENQQILTDLTEFNLSEQIRSCVLLLERGWEKKNLEFSLEFDEHMILANEELLKQVWINLIDNAVKFSPEKGTILVRITEEKQEIKVTVANEGSRIPEEKQKKIFDKFYQADESHASEGNGVGLAIVKRVVDLHQGEIQVKSDGEITSFTVVLPSNL